MLQLAALIASVAATVSPQHCDARTIGPGTRLQGGTAGATCMLAAFRDRCRAATYTLSAYGVDTAHVETFTTRRLAGGRCGVVVVETARVIPQPAHVLSRHTCTRLRKTSTDVVADRCTPKATISLTKLR
jgi:hypothetical protein